MSTQRLHSRAIIGEFYKTLEQDPGVRWVNQISAYFTSDQASEEYAWLGQSPTMREWIGGRNPKTLRDNGLVIANKDFEAAIDIPVKDLRRDKTGQAMVRIRELAQRTNSHWASLLSTLLLNGQSTVCYDGQYFFDTDHAEGDSGTQSNSVTVDISTLPAKVNGTPTAPSPEEAQQAVFNAITKILSFVDDQGEPMNETATQFLVVVPMPLYVPFANGLSMPRYETSAQGLPSEFSVSLAPNARLTSWTDKFATFRVDSETKPFIRQEETAIKLAAKAEGSEYEFDNNAHQYGVDTSRNVGYGYWQHAVLTQMV